MAQLVKNLPAMWEAWVCSLGWEDPLEKGTATHSSSLAGEFHGLYSPGGHKEHEQQCMSNFHFHFGEKRVTQQVIHTYYPVSFLFTSIKQQIQTSRGFIYIVL